MFKQSITYTDPWTSEKVTNDFYFHFTEAELMRLSNDHDDLKNEIGRVSSGLATNKEIIALFEEFISKSYGERSPDGRFVKSKETVDSFLVSEPYSELILSFFDGEEGGKKAAEFMNALMPEDLRLRAEARQAAEAKKPSDQPSAERIEELKERLAPKASDIVVQPTQVSDEGN